MTNEQAINQLKDMQRRCTNGYDAEAINIAIEALDRLTPKTFESRNDYIYEQIEKG